MNLLYLAHRIPYPPNKGEKIRAFHQIKYLAEKHAIHLVCFVDEPEDLPHVDVLKRYCASVEIVYRKKILTKLLAALALFTRQPLSVFSFYSAALARKVAAKLKPDQCDAIFVVSSAMAKYVMHVQDIPKIIDLVDVDSEKWRHYAAFHTFPLSWVYRLEAKRLARYEDAILRSFDRSILISSEEARLVQQRAPGRPVSVVSNGVDFEYFSPCRQDEHDQAPPVLVFVGVMDYFPNVDAVEYFCSEIFPIIIRQEPKALFYIVGRTPSQRVVQLGKLKNVRVTGSVPDVRPYLRKATVAVAPFRLARGVQNKILEAMAMALPVVGTPVAFEGIGAHEEDGVWIRETPQDFALAVCDIFHRTSKMRTQWGRQARRYVERRHQWREQGVKLEELLRQDLVQHRARST